MNVQTKIAARPVVLTGDRTTGPLHLGHYVGSLRNRLALQETNDQFLLLADAQALTDNVGNPAKVRENVLEVVADYLAVGIDPGKTTICLQSALPALAELTFYYLNLVTLARLERNPTVRDEIKQRGFERDIPAGFLCYPVSQAADITAFDADLVPVGADQLPVIEQANEIVARFNALFGETLKPCKAVVPDVGRLPGVDGKGKMGKTSGNAIRLSSSAAEIRQAVNAMYTDPNHLKVSDPGQVEGNVVFTYLDAFDPDAAAVEDLKQRYRCGGLGDSAVKKRLEAILQDLLAPIRERREKLVADPGYLRDVARAGTARAREITDGTVLRVRDAMGIGRI
jgi:tryptophanyl-tRNA synthetase